MSNSTSPRKTLLVFVILVGVFMAMVDSSIVNVALPNIVGLLHTDFLTVQWVVLAYMLTVTSLMMLVGRLADMLSKRTLYTLGFAVFTVGSLLCGCAPTIGALVAARIVQGVGASFTMALGPAIVVQHFAPNERGRIFGLAGSALSLGIIVGPTLGGLLVTAVGWRWIFFVNLPLGVLATALVARVLPADPRRSVEQFDAPGAFTLCAGLLSSLLALTLGQKGVFGDHGSTVLGAVGVGLLAAFGAIELRTRQPLLDLRIFRDAGFSISLAASFFNFIAIAGTVLLMPFYLQNTMGYDARVAGLLLAAMPVVLGLLAPVGGWLSDRYGCQSISGLGLGIMLLGFASVTTLSLDTTPLGYVLRFVPVGAGLALFQSPNNNAILSAAPRDRVGVASGVLSVARTLGQTGGMALMTSLWSWRVAEHGGGLVAGQATTAPPPVQVAALQETLFATVVLTGASLACVGVAAWKERQKRLTSAAAHA